MSYYIGTTLGPGFDEAVRRTTEAFKEEGFGSSPRSALRIR